jgi:hypothetical protein
MMREREFVVPAHEGLVAETLRKHGEEYLQFTCVFMVLCGELNGVEGKGGYNILVV